MIENFWCFVLFLPHVQVVGCERLTLNVPEVQRRLLNPPQARGEHSELWPVKQNFQHLLPANDEPSLRICCSWAAFVQQLSCRWRPVERHSASSLVSSSCYHATKVLPSVIHLVHVLQHYLVMAWIPRDKWTETVNDETVCGWCDPADHWTDWILRECMPVVLSVHATRMDEGNKEISIFFGYSVFVFRGNFKVINNFLTSWWFGRGQSF